MTACGSLKHIFENPLSEKNPSSLISLPSWKQQISTPPTSADHHSFTELLGEFYYKDNTQLLSLSSSSRALSPRPAPSIDRPTTLKTHTTQSYHLGSNTSNTNKPTSDNNKIHHMNSNSLELCTEGLGSESLDDAEYSNKGRQDKIITSKDSESVSSMEKADENCLTTAAHHMEAGIHHYHQYRKSKSTTGRTLPPPISSIGRNGDSGVYLKSYRQDGRFVLQEVRIPTHDEFLHASREDGRLRLRFVQPESDVTDTEEEVDGDWEEVIL